MTETAPEPGFVRVDCQVCKNPDVWFRCNACGRSDHFTVSGGIVRCDCGQTYDRGNCTCGETVPFDGLRFVPFDQGPMALADLEVAWGRVAALGVGLVGIVALGAWWWMG
ncbi:MAG: hypothetical protein H6737_02570 [Alphaproteobacteria bacterium]|nr:hypothetical protein [Alphaproteobacteria bacterium]